MRRDNERHHLRGATPTVPRFGDSNDRSRVFARGGVPFRYALDDAASGIATGGFRRVATASRDPWNSAWAGSVFPAGGRATSRMPYR